MDLNPEACYRAIMAHDARYDGRFFTCVSSTGIYCRPICPGRQPLFKHCTFVPTAAAAQAAGYRPCLRCRPEASPECDAWRGTEATVSRALRLIEAGALDTADIASLAERLGIGERQLRRLFSRHLGAAPITVAQTRRVLLAKQLIHETDLSMLEIALASGFGSVRRFNETFQRMYNRPPSELRRRQTPGPATSNITVLLPYRPPYDWSSMIGFLAQRAIVGLEDVTDTTYSRTIELDHVQGTVHVSHAPEHNSLRVTVRISRLNVLPAIIARIRRQFDLCADPTTITDGLSADPVLTPLVTARPGLRVPGCWDGFEAGVRAVLGQQITIGAATKLATRIATTLGLQATGLPDSTTLTHHFPRPSQFTLAALAGLGLPAARAECLVRLAAAAGADPRYFDPHGDLHTAIVHFKQVKGIGEWTAQYIALRALGESDAFLAGDVGLQRQFVKNGRRFSAAELLARSEQWRPWRAYATLHLWMGNASIPRLQQHQELPHALTA